MMDLLTTQSVELSSPKSFPSNNSMDPNSENPWSNQSNLHQIIEIIYLTVLTIVGTFGNLTVIFSIALEKRVHSHGNIFIINLALADLMITGFVIPTVIANVVQRGLALPDATCTAAGYIVTVTCTCSLSNLTFIAINRYWAVVHSSTYARTFNKKKVYLMVLGTWVWSNLVSMPTLAGWSRIAYDEKIQVCSWDDTFAYSYTIFLTSCAILIPLLVIFFCYTKLFLSVRSSGRWVRSLSSASGPIQSEQNKRSSRKERNLLQTLATTVAFFCVCWLPYGFAIIIDANNVPAQAKKIFGWLGLSNSAVNFIIYGIMNPVFRQGYRNLFHLLLKCKKAPRISSTGLHGFHSDSFFKSAKKRSILNTPELLRSGNGNPNLIKGKFLPYYKTNSDSFCIAGLTPQMPIKGMVNGVKKETNQELQPPAMNLDVQDMPAGKTSSLASLRHPSSFLKKQKMKSREVQLAELEARFKRNSLMLLQIELTDDDNDMAEQRMRAFSEIPRGAKRPFKKRSSSTSGNISHSFRESNLKNRRSSSMELDCSALKNVTSYADEREVGQLRLDSNSCPEHSDTENAEVDCKLKCIRESREFSSVPSIDSFLYHSADKRQSAHYAEAVEKVVVRSDNQIPPSSPEVQ